MSNIIEEKNKLIKEFNQFDNWDDKYAYLIKLGRQLPELEDEFKLEKYRIKGCQSQVWLYPQFNQGIVTFKADSDAMIVKGIVAILIRVYSERTPKEILSLGADFLKEVGITNHLSMNRSNGLAAMTKQIHLYAIAYSSLEGQS